MCQPIENVLSHVVFLTQGCCLATWQVCCPYDTFRVTVLLLSGKFFLLILGKVGSSPGSVLSLTRESMKVWSGNSRPLDSTQRGFNCLMLGWGLLPTDCVFWSQVTIQVWLAVLDLLTVSHWVLLVCDGTGQRACTPLDVTPGWAVCVAHEVVTCLSVCVDVLHLAEVWSSEMAPTRGGISWYCCGEAAAAGLGIRPLWRWRFRCLASPGLWWSGSCTCLLCSLFFSPDRLGFESLVLSLFSFHTWNHWASCLRLHGDFWLLPDFPVEHFSGWVFHSRSTDLFLWTGDTPAQRHSQVSGTV